LEGEHEEGVTSPSAGGAGSAGQQQRGTTLEEEVDNWDENAIDAWEEDDEDAGDVGVAGKDVGGGGAKKRAD
jgi:hypothetical protein